MLGLLRAIGPLCRQAGVPLVANDRVDLAALAGCDYVHLGQSDGPFEQVHRIAPSLRLGISTHTLEQLSAALALRPAYVAYGPVYATTSKAQAEAVVGIDGLRAAHALARAAQIPLVAIGGITLERAGDVAPHAEAGAVIAALLPGDLDQGTGLTEVTGRARRLHAALGEAFAPAEAR
jgi:thiamine-phosphate pyrophosphorylase